MTQTLNAARSSLTSEEVDDIPLLIAHLQRMGIQHLLDKAAPTHGQDISFGWVATLWLAHLLSQSNRQARHLRTWVNTHHDMIEWLTGLQIQSQDLNDARLRDLLRLFNNDSIWERFENELNLHILRNYRLRPERIRLRQTQGIWYVSADGVLQFDQSRRWWPGAMQARVLLAALDPIGLPLTMLLDAANHQHAMTTMIDWAKQHLPQHPLLFIGNGELRTPEVRGQIHAQSDNYLCLLGHEDVAIDQHSILHAHAYGETPHAHNESSEQLTTLNTELAGKSITWQERRILVRSHRQVHDQELDLQSRISKAQRDLVALNERKRGKRRPQTLQAMQEAADAILAEYRVQGLLTISYHEAADARTVRRYRGRPTTTRVEHLITVAATVDEQALEYRREQLGWQVYATTCSEPDLSIEHALRVYGELPVGFERLRGRPLSLLPGVIQRSDQISGLVRLMSLALRCMALLDYAVLTHAAELPPGDWQRSMAHPAGERLLQTFHDINLTVVDQDTERHMHVTSLSSLQRRILDIVNLPQQIYQISAS